MISRALFFLKAGFLLLFAAGLLPQTAHADPCRVLVVMSYNHGYEWVTEITEGIESVLGGKCQITYFYMDTKRDIEGGPRKARQAYALYRELEPDGVIAADDNAQSMFVVPYLKDRVKTPVIFCGVNHAPDIYGYPASNVSGILERFHISESLALAAQLMPSIRTFSYFMFESTTSRAILEDIKVKENTFPLRFVSARTAKTMKEAVLIAEELREKCDAIFMPDVEGITDDYGNPLSAREIVPVLARTSKKPIIGVSRINIRYGILCGVVESGQEQGATAARMLLRAIEGTPVSEIPITRNRKGRAMVNVSVIKTLGIRPKPIILKGAQIVETVE